MKAIHYIPSLVDTQWGDYAGNPNTLVHNATIQRNFITAQITKNTSENLVDTTNNGELYYDNGTISAPIRLVNEFGSTTFLDPSLIVNGWTLMTSNPTDPNTSNTINEGPVMFFGLNETPKKDEENNDYYEVSITGYSNPPQSSVPSLCMLDGINIGDSGDESFNVGFITYDKTINEFSLAINYNSVNYGFVALSGSSNSGSNVDYQQLGVGFVRTIKSFNGFFGIKHDGNAWLKVDWKTIVPIYENTLISGSNLNGGVGSDYAQLEINKSGLKASYYGSQDKYWYNSIFGDLPSNIVVCPVVWFDQRSSSYAKVVRLYGE